MEPRRSTGLRLGIDLDGVVVDFTGGWMRAYNAAFGADLRREQAVTWAAPATLTHFGTMRRFWRWAATAGEGASLFRDLDPYPGALPALRRLARHHQVVIVTTKPRFAVADTFAWLDLHAVPAEEVHVVDDKTSVRCDVYLEDADHNLDDLHAAHPAALVCRFVRPWNRPRPGVSDVETWEQFEELVGESAARR